MFTAKEVAQFQLCNALKSAADGNLKGTLEAEMLREASELSGKQFTTSSFFLPFELLRRDLGHTGGASLIGTETPAAMDVLRPASAAIRAGCQVIEATGNIGLPVVSAPGSAYWLNDGASITESQAVVGAVRLEARNVAVRTEVSGLLMRQVRNMEDFLRRDMTRSIGSALDLAILAGSGVNGEPRGILNTTGVAAVAGAGLTWQGVLAMIEAIENANGTSVSFFGTPAVKKLLSNRERIAGGGRPIWDDGKIAGFNAFAPSNAPAGILTAGDFSRVVVALLGDGLEVAADPASGFQTGAVAFRAWLSCDVGVAQPGAFAVAAGLS